MKLALSLAQKGEGFVNPNPLVGAVIVKNGKIIGEGYHEKYGELHAERKALLNCTENPHGGVMYVTLEPCCHCGKTPPCTEAIIESGIRKIFIGILDPNPLVAGKGLEILKNSGIETEIGLLENECRDQNQVFLHYIKAKTPFVSMKYAMTLDGKIATVSGKSKWITNEKSRKNVHLLRHRYSAIMVGVNTVIDDNPILNSRLPNTNNPIRIICDTNLRTPFDCNIVATAHKIKTIIATCQDDTALHRPYLQKGCEVIVTAKEGNRVDLTELISKLGERKIDSILLEGGSTLNFSALKSRIVNKVYAYIAPKLFGGEIAKTPVGGIGFCEVDNGIILKNNKLLKFDDDILIESEVNYPCSQD